MLYTTLDLLKKHGACTEGYVKLLKHLGGNASKFGRDTPIPLTTVLESNDVPDTLWCLRAVLPEEREASGKLTLLYSADCVERGLLRYEKKYPKDAPLIREFIEKMRGFANGTTTAADFKEVAHRVYRADLAHLAYLAYLAYLADLADEEKWLANRLRAYLEGTPLEPVTAPDKATQ